MACSEHHSGSDVMLKAQRRLCFERTDKSLDPAAESCPSVLHPEDRKQAYDDESQPSQSVSKDVLISEKMLDVGKDFMVGQNKDVITLNCVEQVEVNLPRGDALSYKVVRNKTKNQPNGMLRHCFRFGNGSNVSGSNLQQVPIQIAVPAKSTSDMNQCAKTGFSSYAGMIPTVNTHKRTGFGLHLNSIVRILPTAPPPSHTEMHDANTKPPKLANTRQRHVGQKETKIFKGVGLDQNINIIQGKESSAGGTMSKHLSSYGANTILLRTDIKTVSRPDKRKLRSEQNDLFDELDESAPKRKRIDSVHTQGCSRCNCKRTGCLKLSCDCYVAGSYCDGTCSCQGRFNKPIFHDIVRETRAQIISRNPLAFSSNAVETVSKSVRNNVEITQPAPSVSKNKRGCNCKKTTCLMEYCECYQAHIRCSNSCRCEACKNIYGKNTELDDLQQTSLTEPVQGYDSTYGNNLMTNMKKTIISQTDFSNLQYHQFVTLSANAPKNRSFSTSDHLSVGSLSFHDSRTISRNQNTSKPQSIAYINDIPINSSSNSTHQTLYDWTTDSNSSEKLTNLQPSYDADRYGHSQSNSTLNCTESFVFSASSRTRKRLSQDHRLPFASPMVTHGQSSHKKLHAGNDYGFNLSDKKENETGTPDHSTPVNSVSVRSPNERRVFHRKALALHNLDSGSSYTLTKAGKFMLKALPTLQAPAIDNSQKKNSETE